MLPLGWEGPFWSKIQKTRTHPGPSISVLKNHILNRADPGVRLIWGVFGGKLSLSKGAGV